MNASSPNPVREIPGLKFEREMGAAARPVLAHFFTSWSEPCRLLAPALEALADELGDDLEVVAVNLDHCPELARRVGVTAIPALLASVQFAHALTEHRPGPRSEASAPGHQAAN
ncbi:MAG TPA: thioredoxin family protein [Verrucomicrobiae bacterium]|nr:thioredoxin family protein [Verrucomicrobiae bacterium]